MSVELYKSYNKRQGLGVAFACTRCNGCELNDFADWMQQFLSLIRTDLFGCQLPLYHVLPLAHRPVVLALPAVFLEAQLSHCGS